MDAATATKRRRRRSHNPNAAERFQSCLRDGRPCRAMSVRQVSMYWSIAPERVRALIRTGVLVGVDFGFGKRRVKITPMAIAERERKLAVRLTRTPRRRTAKVDREIARLLGEDVA